jgi:hypothetical protein
MSHLNYRSTVDASVDKMMRNSEDQALLRGTWQRHLFCLLLVAFLLYNPFFTILSISQDLSVQHTLSYRATLAGSELRRCTVEDAQPLTPALHIILAHAAALFVSSHKVALVQPDNTSRFLSLDLCDSVWFRPPPSA